MASVRNTEEHYELANKKKSHGEDMEVLENYF